MPHFSSCCKDADEYICQVCGKICCSGCQPSSWRSDITGHKSAGNICPKCLKKFEEEKDNAESDIVINYYKITSKDGLLYQNGIMINLPEADTVARKCGFNYAERLVKYLENRGKTNGI